jgi:hypothetical protein
MRSSAEIAAEKNAEKIEALEKRRHDAFVNGLEALDSFDLERIEKDISRAQYESDSRAELTKIMAKGHVIARAKPGSDDE